MTKSFSEKLGYSCWLIIYCVLAVASVLLFYGTAGMISAQDKGIPAILVFGDSIVDSGNNNNNLKTVTKCNFPPHGRDFMGSKPTGRFSNGKVPSDIIAEEVGLKELVPAYLDPNLQLQDLLTGVSFASGSAGYDPLTAKLTSVLSLSDQLDLFRDFVKKIHLGGERTAEFVSSSVYVVCIGSVDIANTYPFRRSQYDINSYTDLWSTPLRAFTSIQNYCAPSLTTLAIVGTAYTGRQELYGHGARKIVVLSLPPIGCVPSQRTLGGGVNRECNEFNNQAAMLFNSKLSSTIDSINRELPDSRIVYADIYNPFLSLIQNPAQYGFEEATKGCCGTGNIEVSILCNRFDDSNTCKDASQYIFWDSYHPTEKAYKIIVSKVLNEVINKLL